MKSSVDVHNFLQSKGIQHEIFLTSIPPMSAKRASAILGLELKEITKSVVFFCGNKPFLILVPGNLRVSYKKLKNILNEPKVRLATPDEVIKNTGYTIGATPPVCFNNELKIIIDKKVIEKEIVYTGGGEVTAILKIKSNDLKKITEAAVEDISEEIKQL